MSFFAPEADAPWFSGAIDPSVRLPLGIPPLDPSAAPPPVRRDPGEQAALLCDGYPGGCQSGGSFGSGAMFRLDGLNLCPNCAAKKQGLDNMSFGEKIRALLPHIIVGPTKK